MDRHNDTLNAIEANPYTHDCCMCGDRLLEDADVIRYQAAYVCARHADDDDAIRDMGVIDLDEQHRPGFFKVTFGGQEVGSIRPTPGLPAGAQWTPVHAGRKLGGVPSIEAAAAKLMAVAYGL